MRYTTLILTLFASVIACGVIYNNARIALSTRGRDLASLRVLGFRRARSPRSCSASWRCRCVLALGPGRVPRARDGGADDGADRSGAVSLPGRDLGADVQLCIVVTLAAALVSALLVRRRLDQLDLIGVLKSRE